MASGLGMSSASTEPPGESDSRLAEPGSPYRPSGRVGAGWVALVPAILIGALSGYVFGALIGWMAARTPGGMRIRRARQLLIVILIPVLATCLAGTIFTWLGHVRATWFVFVVGLLGGAMFSLAALCTFVACANGSPPTQWGAALSASLALFSDLGALERGLAQAIPSMGIRATVIAVGALAAIAVGGLTVAAHGVVTNGNLYDEAAGKWYLSPVPVAALDGESRPRERWRLSAWTAIADPEEFARRSTWILMREHPSALQPGQGMQPGGTDARAGLPLVSLATVTVTEKRKLRLFPPRRDLKREISTEPIETPFFVSREELAALRAMAGDPSAIPDRA